MNGRRAFTLWAFALIGAGELLATLPLGRADDGFTAVLAEANISADQAPLAELASAPLVDAQCAHVLGRLFHRLEAFPYSELERQATRATLSGSSPALWGQPVRVAGTIRSCERLEIEPAGRLPGGAEAYYRSLLETETGTWRVLSPTAPRAWREGGWGRNAEAATSSMALAEPAEAVGIFVGATPGELRGAIEAGEAVLAATRLAWFPTQGVPAGVRWLSSQGMDASLWDDVRQRRGLAHDSSGGEAEAFYSCLTAVSRTSTEDMLRMAQRAIADSRDDWRRERDAVRAELAALRATVSGAGDRAPTSAASPSPSSPSQATPSQATPSQASPAETPRAPSAPTQVASLERQAAFLDEGLRAAEEGQTAYAPLWEWPERHAGEFVVLEGTARRAVRVETPATRSAPNFYFEVDVYPTDSRSLPAICCVATLPTGFPQGDEIHEPVRVAGVFFKSWRYRRRAIAPAEGAGARRTYAPLVFAATPQWLALPGRRGQIWPLIGGGLFLAAIGALWWTAARSARRDRHARRQFSGRIFS